MATPDCPHPSLPRHGTPESPTPPITHLLQHHDVILHPSVVINPATDVSWKQSLARGLLVLAATAALLISLSAHAQNPPTGFTIDGALLSKVQMVDYSWLLCWEELSRPFLVKTSLTMEVGQNIQGTLVFTIPAFHWEPLEGNRTVSGWPRKMTTRATNDDSSMARTLGLAPTPPPYSHTESQVSVDSRINQIDSPLPLSDRMSNTENAEGRSFVLPMHETPRAKRYAHLRLSRQQRPIQAFAVNVHVRYRGRDHLIHSVQNMSLTEDSGTRERRKKPGSVIVSKEGDGPEPNDLRDHVTRRHSVAAPDQQEEEAVSARVKINTSRPPGSESSSTTSRGESSTRKFVTKASRRLRFWDMVVTSHSWESLAGDDDNMFVYSAFYDERSGLAMSTVAESPRQIRVLGVCVRRPLEEVPELRGEVFCHYRWRANPDLHVIQRGNILSVQDGMNTTYHAVFVICDLHLCASPDFVGITLDGKLTPRSYLPVQYPPPVGQRFQDNVTTCLPVMHSRFRDYMGLLQVLEADRLLGIEKFRIYVHDASPEVSAILRYYVSSGVMEAMEWRLPTPVLVEEGEEEEEEALGHVGRLVAANDCVYSAMFVSRHVVFHGFRHPVLPRQHSSWTRVLQALQQQEEASLWEWWRRTLGGADYGSYTFQHVLFPDRQTPNDVTKRSGGSILSAVPPLLPPFTPPSSTGDGTWRETDNTHRMGGNINRANNSVDEISESRGRKSDSMDTEIKNRDRTIGNTDGNNDNVGRLIDEAGQQNSNTMGDDKNKMKYSSDMDRENENTGIKNRNINRRNNGKGRMKEGIDRKNEAVGGRNENMDQKNEKMDGKDGNTARINDSLDKNENTVREDEDIDQIKHEIGRKTENRDRNDKNMDRKNENIDTNEDTLDEKNRNINRTMREDRLQQRIGPKAEMDREKGSEATNKRGRTRERNSTGSENPSHGRALRPSETESKRAAKGRHKKRRPQNTAEESVERSKRDPPLESDTDKSDDTNKTVLDSTRDPSFPNTIAGTNHHADPDPRVLDVDQLQEKARDRIFERVYSRKSIMKHVATLEGGDLEPLLGMQLNMLIKPHTVQVMGGHSVQLHVKGYQSKVVPTLLAEVHHRQKREERDRNSPP